VLHCGVDFCDNRIGAGEGSLSECNRVMKTTIPLAWTLLNAFPLIGIADNTVQSLTQLKLDSVSISCLRKEISLHFFVEFGSQSAKYNCSHFAVLLVANDTVLFDEIFCSIYCTTEIATFSNSNGVHCRFNVNYTLSQPSHLQLHLRDAAALTRSIPIGTLQLACLEAEPSQEKSCNLTEDHQDYNWLEDPERWRISYMSVYQELARSAAKLNAHPSPDHAQNHSDAVASINGAGPLPPPPPPPRDDVPSAGDSYGPCEPVDEDADPPPLHYGSGGAAGPPADMPVFVLNLRRRRDRRAHVRALLAAVGLGDVRFVPIMEAGDVDVEALVAAKFVRPEVRRRSPVRARARAGSRTHVRARVFVRK
jgi:hypothetical protein